jgi:signal transduction histidine kinase
MILLSRRSLLHCCGIVGWMVAAASSAQVPIEKIADIRTLNEDQIHQRAPVRLDAVVTFYHKEWGVLFVHDGTDGVCVGVSVDQRPAQPFQPGMRLAVEGVLGPGEFLPVVWPDRIEVIGTAPVPDHPLVAGEDLFSPALDARPVSAEAVVKGTTFSDQSLVLDLQIDGWTVRAILPQDEAEPQPPWQLLERQVRVRGVAGTHFNDQRQMSGRLLFVQDVESLQLMNEPTAKADVPLVPVDGLLRVDTSLRQRVRLRGVVTHRLAGRGMYLRGAGGSLFVQTAQPVGVERGHEVEALGYPIVTAFRPALSALDVQKLGQGAAPEPVAFAAADQRNSREQCELVWLDAELIELTPGREALTLLCRADGHLFEALLPNSHRPAEALMPGMKLRLTGICELVSTRPLVIPRNATAFRILLRDAADIQVIERQPFWNERRAAWALGVVGVLALAIGGWAVGLQVMVRQQSSVIRQQAEQQATLEERERIARDLHDTLEQELVGVTMLLDNTSSRLNGSPTGASEPLQLARKLLRRAREESRSTIRELRSVALQQRGLAGALDELLRPLATAAGADFSLQVAGEEVRQSGTAETHLLRIAQEAVANAAKHAGAKQISVRLAYSDADLTLTIRDDGRGFDPQSPAPTGGHFGLNGMKERADKLAAGLQVQSQPGHGTSIVLRMPLTQPAQT